MMRTCPWHLPRSLCGHRHLRTALLASLCLCVVWSLDVGYYHLTRQRETPTAVHTERQDVTPGDRVTAGSRQSRASLDGGVTQTPRAPGNGLLHLSLVDPRHKVFYCLVGKAGSTTWLSLLVRATGLVSPDTPLNNGNLHNISWLARLDLDLVYNFTSQEVNAFYGQRFFKLLVVRHPLQRLVSTYYDKVVDKPRYNLPLKERFWRSFGHTALSLLEFVEFVTSQPDADPHWTPIERRCRVCDVTYDHVIRVERTLQRKGPLLSRLGLPANLAIGSVNANPRTGPGQDKLTKYDSDLKYIQDARPDLMRKLLQLYGSDMKMFGYGWNSHNSTISEDVPFTPNLHKANIAPDGFLLRK